MSLMANWPADLPVPVVMVQHMPPMFTRMLAEHLSAKSGLRVVEATDAEALRPGQGYVAPGDHHMCLAGLPGNVRVRLHQEPHENSCRPSADVLFRSVAEVYGAHALAVVLTGMGQDGLRGSERIRDQGGKVLAQDEASSVVWGMAGAVVRAGLAEEIGPPSELSAAILRRVRHGRLENRARQPNLDRAVGAAA
jgi:two-component system chemotaxis response regulator CheB